MADDRVSGRWNSDDEGAAPAVDRDSNIDNASEIGNQSEDEGVTPEVDNISNADSSSEVDDASEFDSTSNIAITSDIGIPSAVDIFTGVLPFPAVMTDDEHAGEHVGEAVLPDFYDEISLPSDSEDDDDVNDEVAFDQIASRSRFKAKNFVFSGKTDSEVREYEQRASQEAIITTQRSAYRQHQRVAADIDTIERSPADKDLHENYIKYTAGGLFACQAGLVDVATNGNEFTLVVTAASAPAPLSA